MLDPDPQRVLGDARRGRDPSVQDQGEHRPDPGGRGLRRRLRGRHATRRIRRSRSASATRRSASERSPASGGSRSRAAGSTAERSELPRVLGGLGVAIISTSQGVMTDKQARRARGGRRSPRLRLVAEERDEMSRVGQAPITDPLGGRGQRSTAGRSPSTARRASCSASFPEEIDGRAGRWRAPGDPYQGDRARFGAARARSGACSPTWCKASRRATRRASRSTASATGPRSRGTTSSLRSGSHTR